MNYYLQVLKKYAVFSGRARRSEYWFFVLFNTLAYIAVIALDNILGLTFQGIAYGVLYALYSLAVIIPSLSVLVRRLHDTNKSGWYFLIGLIPIIGGIILLVFLVQDSAEGENEYGPNPKLA